MTATTSPAGGLAPRSARTRRAVLDATAALMAEKGLAATTVDAIRDRSGVSKTTIYKHWPNRLCVAIDAFTEQLAAGTSIADTGTTRGDLAEQISRVSAFYSSPAGSAFVPLLAHAMQDPVAAGWLGERFIVSRQHGIQELWSRAVERGDVRHDIDPGIAMDLLFGPVMWRLLSGRPPLTRAEAQQFADGALDGLLAPGPDVPDAEAGTRP